MLIVVDLCMLLLRAEYYSRSLRNTRNLNEGTRPNPQSLLNHNRPFQSLTNLMLLGFSEKKVARGI